MTRIMDGSSELASWIRKEIQIEEPLGKGTRGQAARRIQEWLNLHNMGVDVDGDFGRITERKVKQFQEVQGLPATGIVDNETFQAFVSPLRRVLAAIPAVSNGQHLPGLMLAYAQAHLREHPREVGGQNRGPWVRLYMNGHEGAQWAWCAGFVSFVMKQATETLQQSLPVPGSFSCDSLAAQGKSAALFVPQAALERGSVTVEHIPAGSMFLVRRTSSDWTHTGLVSRFHADSFDTIEGNTNDDGDREGYEVCARTRGYRDKDFIKIPG